MSEKWRGLCKRCACQNPRRKRSRHNYDTSCLGTSTRLPSQRKTSRNHPKKVLSSLRLPEPLLGWIRRSRHCVLHDSMSFMIFGSRVVCVCQSTLTGFVTRSLLSLSGSRPSNTILIEEKTITIIIIEDI